jgi:hypothetical protein
MSKDRKVLQVRLPSDVYSELSRLAAMRGLDVSKFVRNYIIEDFLFNSKIIQL